MIKRYFLLLVFTSGLLFSQEIDTRKTSELELFLFKIGFESLLKDVELTKDKSQLNEEQISKIQKQLKVLVKEVYKEKELLTTDSSKPVVVKDLDTLKQVSLLKEEIDNLKKEIVNLKNQKKTIKDTKAESLKSFMVFYSKAYVRSKPHAKAKILKILNKGESVFIDSCDKFGWCKLKDKKQYIAGFTLVNN